MLLVAVLDLHGRYHASDVDLQGYLEALTTISSDYYPALSVQMNGIELEY